MSFADELYAVLKDKPYLNINIRWTNDKWPVKGLIFTFYNSTNPSLQREWIVSENELTGSKDKDYPLAYAVHWGQVVKKHGLSG